MKSALILLLVVSLAGLVSPGKAGSEDKGDVSSKEGDVGRRLYQERGCGACHAPAKDQSVHGLGPSVKQIAEAYSGREDQLMRFLRGGCDPVIDEASYPIMHGQIVKLKELSDADLQALGKHVLGSR